MPAGSPMRRAIAIACEQVAAGGGPFGALVLRDGRVIAEGGNRVAIDSDPTAHAEIVAIRAACRALGRFDLRGCEIVSSCEPCPMCRAAIHWARLDRVTYAADRRDAARAGFDDDALHREFAARDGARAVASARVAHPDALAPFAAWARRADRTPY